MTFIINDTDNDIDYENHIDMVAIVRMEDASNDCWHMMNVAEGKGLRVPETECRNVNTILLYGVLFKRLRRVLVENCRLTIPVVRDALPHLLNIDELKRILTMNLQTWLKVVMLHSTPMIAGISHRWRQLLAWKEWWHAPAFVTRNYLMPCICIYGQIKPAAMKNVCPFPP